MHAMPTCNKCGIDAGPIETTPFCGACGTRQLPPPPVNTTYDNYVLVISGWVLTGICFAGSVVTGLTTSFQGGELIGMWGLMVLLPWIIGIVKDFKQTAHHPNRKNILGLSSAYTALVPAVLFVVNKVPWLVLGFYVTAPPIYILIRERLLSGQMKKKSSTTRQLLIAYFVSLACLLMGISANAANVVAGRAPTSL
jgi:hypothetical protein